MNQEQIERMENIINKDYANMAGMVIMKDGETVMKNTLMVVPKPTVFIFFL